MFKFDVETLIAHPVHTSAFVVDFALLVFLPLIRPPVLLSLIFLVGLVYLAMFFGAKFARSVDFGADGSGRLKTDSPFGSV